MIQADTAQLPGSLFLRKKPRINCYIWARDLVEQQEFLNHSLAVARAERLQTGARKVLKSAAACSPQNYLHDWHGHPKSPDCPQDHYLQEVSKRRRNVRLERAREPRVEDSQRPIVGSHQIASVQVSVHVVVPQKHLESGTRCT